MSIVLDASMALAWHFGRQDPLEDSLASKCLVEIGVHGPGIAFASGRSHDDLIRDHLSRRDPFCNGFGLGLVRVRGNVSAKGHDAFVAILRDSDVFESGLVERFAETVRHIGRLRTGGMAPCKGDDYEQGEQT